MQKKCLISILPPAILTNNFISVMKFVDEKEYVIRLFCRELG